jgi:hypothetical protein
MGDGKDKAIPRWAAELGDATWERINELLHDGWDTPDIIRELNVPASKLRSLQLYARKYGPRRRLILFDGFKQNLLSAGAELGPKFSKALAVIAEHAVSTSVKESTQQRAVDLMLEFAKTLGGMMAPDEKAEREREGQADAKQGMVSAADVVARILDLYGVKRKPLDGP